MANDEKEYGRIIVLLKDGTEGSALAITKEILFGRDKTADIRIKLNSVSRQHTLITIQNGQCVLKHLSKTNPTRVNGIEVVDEVHLKNRDEISIAERKFIFETVTDATMTEEPQGVLKAVAVDSIDDCITVDYSRNNLEKRRRASVCAKNPATQTLASTLIRSKTETKPSSTVSLPIPKVEKKTTTEEATPPPKQECHSSENHLKIGLPTPVKRAIQSRRKSISFDLEKLQEIQSSRPEATKSHEPTESESAAKAPSLSIDTALDRAIVQHQNKLQDELREIDTATNTPLSIPTIEPNLQTPREVINPETAYSVMKTPLKREIHARRITRSAVKVLETDSPVIAEEPPLIMTPLPHHTPIRPSTRSSRKSVDPASISDTEPVIERRLTRQSLKTPLKNAIQSRRKSLVTVVETLDRVLDEPISAPERSALQTPLKKAIQARRKSYAAQVEALDNLALTENVNETDELKEEYRITSFPVLPEPSPVKEAPRALISPLKKAIEMRRRSLQAEVDALDKLDENPLEAETGSNAPKRIRLSLQRAIHSRRRSLTKEIDRLSDFEKDMESKDDASLIAAISVAPQPLPKPLLEAIESRRYNLKGEVKILDEIAYLATQEEETQSHSNASNEKQVLRTPIRNAIQSRRRSYSNTSVTENNQNSVAIRVLHTPLRHAIQSRRKSLMAEIASLQDSLNSNLSDSFSCAAASIGANMDNNADILELGILKSPFVGDVGVEYEAHQLCARLSIASYASSIGRMEEFDNPDEALADALECFLEQPEAFYSPRRSSFSSSRRFQGETLLSTIQQKGTEISTPVNPEMIADIMSSITDEELAMIDKYSKQLVSVTGMEDEEAYARCLDAYIQGVEAAMRVNDVPSNQEDATAISTAPVSSTNAKISTPISANIQQGEPLSESKIDFLEQKKLDMQLIMAYADDLEYSANLRPEIAYGIALDTYLADPFSFRQNVKAMKVNPTTPIEWIEYDEERLYEEEDNDEMVENKDDVYDGETENESDDHMHNSAPVLNLPSPITEEEKVDLSQPEDAERLVTDGPMSPLVSPKPRGRKKKESLVPAPAAQIAPTVETVEPIPLAPTPTAAGRKRGRPSKAKNNNSEDVEPVAEVEEQSSKKPREEVESKADDKEEVHNNTSPRGSKKSVTLQASVESVVDSTENTLATDSAGETTVKSGRGRKKVEPSTADLKSSPVESEVEKKPAKSARGKRKATALEAGDTKVEASMKVETVVEADQPTEVVDSKSTKTLRGKRKVEEEQGTTQSFSAPVEVQEVDHPEPQQAVKATKSTRGKRKATKGTPVDEEPQVSEEAPTQESTLEKSARGGRGKRKVPEDPSPQKSESKVTKSKQAKASKGAKKGPVEESDDDMEEAIAILCDSCDQEYFMDEVGLTAVPEGDWYCVKCQSKKQKTEKSTTASKRGKRAPPPSKEEESKPKRSTRGRK